MNFLGSKIAIPISEKVSTRSLCLSLSYEANFHRKSMQEHLLEEGRYLIKRRLNSHLMIWRWAELIYYLLRFHGQNVKMPNLEPLEGEVTGAIRQRNQGA